jgi:hypothetical protein
MAYIVTGETPSNYNADFGRVNYSYSYPNDMKLKPGSKLHDFIRDEILQRARVSRNVISSRFPSWNETDRILTSYVALDDDEEDLQDRDPSKPVSIVFPYSYAMLETLLTYLSLAFFQDPIFRYEGYTQEDKVGAMMLEHVVNLHCIKWKVQLSLHTLFRDALSYGIGVCAPTWGTRWGKRPVKTTEYDEGIFGSDLVRDINSVETVKILEGNKLTNIDPYLFLPDPNVSATGTQDGEYVGWIDKDNLMNLLRDESNGSGLFNVKYIKHAQVKLSSLTHSVSSRQMKFGSSDTRSTDSTTNAVDVIYMYIDIIPNDWELGSSEDPEKWLFALAADSIVIQAEKADRYHGMYPVTTCSPEFDGYSPLPISRMEILYGLQHILDFFFNTHITNIRKVLNDMIVVDPYLVNIKDLEDPKPGKIIRLRRPAWGRGVENVIKQLNITDVTRQNISDSSYITSWMDRIAGADQSMMGSLRQGGPERLSGAEFQGTRGSAISRLQKLASLTGLQAMQDIGTMFASHTQEFLSEDIYVRIAGEHSEFLKSIYGSDSMKVTPNDLNINYDIIVRDGSIPGGNFSESWINLFQTISSSPELQQQFDVTKIFTYIAAQLGAKDVESFRRINNNTNVQVMPDEEVMNQVNAGNMVPLGV